MSFLQIDNCQLCVDVLVIVKPETILAWQKQRFKNHWAILSMKNKKPGRPKVKEEIRELIKRMARENLNWGAPKILSVLQKLGYTKQQISQPTVSRYLRKFRPDNPETTRKKRQQWKTFLGNHREHIMAMDFFTIQTYSFKILYVFFIIDHSRRKIVHYNTTDSPTAQWVLTQLRNAFPFETAPEYLIFDRGSAFNSRVKKLIRDMFTKPKVTGYRCPWQNGVAERFVLSVRKELLDHVIIFDDNNLKNYMRAYIAYYNSERAICQ